MTDGTAFEKEFKLKSLYDYQQDAFDWACDRDRVAFFLEMRLGKTLTSIRWAESKSLQKILVVCPLAVVSVWQDHLFEDHISSTILTGTPKQKETLLEDQDTRWYITNYESAFVHGLKSSRIVPSLISDLAWDAILLDESPYIRNPQAKRTKAIKKFFKYTCCIGLLSGLPDPEGPLDYYEQMAFLNGGSFLGCDSFWKFRVRYFKQGWTEWDWIPKKGTITKIKEAVNEMAFVLSRKQAGIGSKKIRSKRYVQLPARIQKAYQKLEKEFAIGGSETKWIISRNVWLARLAGGRPDEQDYWHAAKLNELLYLLQGDLKHEQVVVWFRFNTELEAVKVDLQAKGISCASITGKVKQSDRTVLEKKFRKNKFRVFLVQIKCGKFGLDYSTSSTAIYFSNSYEFEERSQSEDRIIHPAKTDPCLIIDIIAEDTIDEDVCKAINTKGMNAKIFKSRIAKNLKERIAKC